ncbi:MAG TPA: hypothetical protein VKN99_00910 [Polyangia bacterium]|nr:hypothetical protein [Polyangia bacterium]
MAQTLAFSVVAGCEPARFARLGQALLAQCAQPTLLLAELSGAAVMLGRFQRAPSALHVERARADGLALVRRSGGGRALAAGEGSLGVLLALPALGHLLPKPVGADKVLNRYLRGLMAGLTLAGAGNGAHYFGRDFLSARQCELARVSQDGAPAGPVLVEAVVAVTRPLALPHGLPAYPPHPDPRAAGPPPVTLAALAGRRPTLEQLADAIAAGHARVYGCPVERRELTLADGPAPEPPALEQETGWAQSGPAPVPIGFVEALVRADASGTLQGARLRGDFIAPAFAVAALERALAGCPLAHDEIGRRVDAAFRGPGATIVGVVKLETLAERVLSAARV